MIHEESSGDENASRFAEDIANDCTWCAGKGWLLKDGAARHCNACNGTGVKGGKIENIPSGTWTEILRPNREEYL